MIRISDALQVLRPGAEWSIGNNSYSELDWLDTEQTKPTEEEVVQKIAELTYQEEVELYKEERISLKFPYQLTADNLSVFLKREDELYYVKRLMYT